MLGAIWIRELSKAVRTRVPWVCDTAGLGLDSRHLEGVGKQQLGKTLPLHPLPIPAVTLVNVSFGEDRRPTSQRLDFNEPALAAARCTGRTI